jgi:hypothetical protein
VTCIARRPTPGAGGTSPAGLADSSCTT